MRERERVCVCMCVCVVKASRVVTSVSSLRSSPVDVCELHTPLSLTASSPALVWLMLLLSMQLLTVCRSLALLPMLRL